MKKPSSTRATRSGADVELIRNPKREAARQALAHDQADPLAQRRPDLVQRDFAAAGPNELWVADISYLRCWEGLVFFAFVLDAYSRMIVGWQLAGHMRTDLAVTATVARSTRASTTPRRSSIIVSSLRSDRSATRTTNAIAESFVDGFKTELISPSSSTSAGTTPHGWTNHSATSRHSNTNSSTVSENQLRSSERPCDPTNPVPVKTGPAQYGLVMQL
jgi:transposase InsO family protein